MNTSDRDVTRDPTSSQLKLARLRARWRYGLIGGCWLCALLNGLTAAESRPVSGKSPDGAPRPSVVLSVRGGPDDHIIWRGWPVLIQPIVLQGQTPTSLSMTGPSVVTPVRGEKEWLIPATVSAQLLPGDYVIDAGLAKAEVMVADPPTHLSPDEHNRLRQLATEAALATGISAEAVAMAKEWVAAAPQSLDARVALGDALWAEGKLDEAVLAFNEALRFVPKGIRPPSFLYARAARLNDQIIAALPVKPSTYSTPDEVAYTEAIVAGDRAFAAGNLPEAAKKYAAAAALYRDRGLTVPPDELQLKQARLQAAAGQPNAGSPNALPVSPGSGTATPKVPPPVPVVSNVVTTTTPSSAAAGSPATPKMASPSTQSARSESVGVVLTASEFSDAKVTADPNGQWAIAATAGSQYGKTQYSAAKAVGAPDVPVAGNSPDAWCPAAQNVGTDWLEVSFAKPVHATEVRARQNDKPGAIAKVEAIEPDGTEHGWWEGVDPYVAPASRDIAWFVVRVPKTDYLVAKVKFTLNLAAVPGWKEIDAVQLVGTGP